MEFATPASLSTQHLLGLLYGLTSPRQQGPAALATPCAGPPAPSAPDAAAPRQSSWGLRPVNKIMEKVQEFRKGCVDVPRAWGGGRQREAAAGWLAQRTPCCDRIGMGDNQMCTSWIALAVSGESGVELQGLFH